MHLNSLASRKAFERCRIARDDDVFFASVVRQLYVALDSTLLFVCTNITHLYLLEYTDTYNYKYCCLSSLRHLQNLTHLAFFGLPVDHSFSFPPKITHLQFRCYRWPGDITLNDLQFTHNIPSLSHIFLDFAYYEFQTFADELPGILDTLPPHLHGSNREISADKIKSLQERYHPLVFLVDRKLARDVFHNIVHCDRVGFQFWDEMDKFLSKKGLQRSILLTQTADIDASITSHKISDLKFALLH